MLGESENQGQKNLFSPCVNRVYWSDSWACITSNRIDWTGLEKEFSETLVKAWNAPNMQYFCDMAHFQHHFRKRNGEEGIEKMYLAVA